MAIQTHTHHARRLDPPLGNTREDPRTGGGALGKECSDLTIETTLKLLFKKHGSLMHLRVLVQAPRRSFAGLISASRATRQRSHTSRWRDVHADLAACSLSSSSLYTEPRGTEGAEQRGCL